jgi:hypothetical protein
MVFKWMKQCSVKLASLMGLSEASWIQHSGPDTRPWAATMVSRPPALPLKTRTCERRHRALTV